MFTFAGIVGTTTTEINVFVLLWGKVPGWASERKDLMIRKLIWDSEDQVQVPASGMTLGSHLGLILSPPPLPPHHQRPGFHSRISGLDERPRFTIKYVERVMYFRRGSQKKHVGVGNDLRLLIGSTEVRILS